MKELGKVRQIQAKIQDYFAPGASLDKEIAEAAVQKFCGGCDYLPKSGQCKITDSNDQARYAARKFCGWAAVDGVNGEMTADGFKK